MTTTSNNEGNVSVLPYVSQYAVAYLAAGVAFALLDEMTGLRSSWAAIFVAMVLPANKFVGDHGRPFSDDERMRFSLLANLAMWLVSVGVMALLSPAAIAELSSDLLIVAVVFGGFSLASFALIYFVAGAMTRSVAERPAS